MKDEEIEALWSLFRKSKDNMLTIHNFLNGMRFVNGVVLNDHASEPMDEVASYTWDLINKILGVSKRACEKGAIKTAHSFIEVIDLEQLEKLEQDIHRTIVSDEMKWEIQAIKNMPLTAAPKK